MVNTTLRDYLDELNLLLEQEALEEVIGHCRHILQHFPKNVETYRLLGRALLERGRHVEAADVFQRVLSSTPDDFVSHLGLSSVSEEQQQIPTAIWHLECAYEQDPNNTALQGELKRLYERRDGAMPDRIQLTKGALIRIYAKSQLYDQTLKELENALQQSPDRFDLLQLQAKTLWDSGHPVEAADTALQILEKLPNNIEANRIMASLWLKGGRPSEAESFVSRLEQLDPFKAWATVHPDGRPLPHDAFQLPHLDWDVRAAAAMATDVPDWVNAIGNVFDAPESVSLGGSANWLEDAPQSGRVSASPFDLGGRQRGPEPAPEPASSVQMPDWMEDLIPGGSAPFTQSPIADSDVPVWFTDDSPASDSSTTGIAGLPEWFEEAVGGTDGASNSAPALPNWLNEDDKAEAQLLTDAGEPPRSAPSLDAMSWLATGPLPPLEGGPSSKHDSDFDNKSAAYMDLSKKPAEPSDDLPDLDLSWFESESAKPSFQQDAPSAESRAISDLDWLQNDGDSEPSDTAGGDADYPIERGSLPDWLGASATESEPATMDEESAQSDEGSSGIDWLSNMPNLGATGTEAVQPEEPAIDMDWLNDMSSLDAPSTEPAQPAEEVQPAEASSVPDWLSSMPSLDTLSTEPAQAEDIQPAEAGSGLDWLSDMPSLDTFGSEPAQAAEEVQPAEANSGLDWLSDMPSLDTLGTEPAQAEDIQPAETGSGLDWLSSMPELDLPSAQAEDIQPAEASSGLDWLSDMPSLDTLGTEPAEDAQPAEASSGLDWLSDMPSLDTLGTEPAQAEDVQPAEASSGLDWLSDMPSLDTLGTEPAQAEDVQPAEANTGLDWLNNMPSLYTLGTEPAQAEDIQPAETGSGLDWLSSMPELDLPSAQVEDIQPAEASSGLDWLSDMPSLDTLGTEPAQAEDVQPAEANTGLDWLSDMPSLDTLGTEPAQAEDIQPAETGSGLDWLSSMPELDLPSAQVEDIQPAEANSGLDWLSEMPSLDTLGTEPAQVEDIQPAETGSGLDWLNNMPELDSLGTEPAEDVQPAEASSGLDWLNNMPSLDTLGTEPAQAEDVQPAEASSGLDWLSSMPELDSLGTEPAPAEDVQPAEASSGLDWLNNMPSLDTLGTELAPAEDVQPAEASSGLDWLSDMPSLDTLGTQPAEDVQPAEASSGLDWLSDMPSLASPDTEPADEVQPAEANSGLDWLNNMPELDSLGEQAAAPADEVQPAETSSGLNWLSDLPSLDSLGVEPAQPAEANTGLDWLSSMPSLDSLDEGIEAIPAQAVDDDLGLDWLNNTPADSLLDSANTAGQDNGLYELHGKSSEESPAGWSLDQAMVEISAEPADDGDPLAWMHNPQTTADITDEKPNDDDSPVAAAPPAWLTAMMPPMPGEDTDEPAPAPKVSLDQLDFGGLNSSSVDDTDFSAEEPITPTNDWLSSLDTAPSPAPSLDWLGQTATPEQPPVELEDDWLASFESPTNAAPSQAAQPSNGQSMFDDPVSDSTLPDLDWLTGGSPADSATDAPLAEPKTGETVASAADDWLSSFGMGAADSVETPVEDMPLQLDESAEPASNHWMSTLGIDIPPEEPALENDTPSWMASEQPSPKAEEQTENEWVGPDGKDHFNSMIMRVGDLSSTSTPRAPKDTGILEPNAAPDWLTALHDEADDQVSSATEFADAEETRQPNPASNLISTEAAGTLSADSTPDWMTAFEPEPENKVADPANLVDTSIHEGTPSPSFAFDRTPKWMRKKSETGSLSKPANSDAAWRRDAEPKDNSDTDTPDWLR